MSEIRFGSDGWRAIIAEDFTFTNVRLLTQGIANYLKNNNLTKKGIVVGYDNRFQSEQFADECAQVLVGNGIRVSMLRKSVPTPLVAHAIRVTQAGGAVMITASHNPPEYNGIKFIPEYAGPALPEVTSAIEEEVKRIQECGKVYQLNLQEAETLDLIKEIDLDKDYISQIYKAVNPEYFQQRKLKVVVNPMFGSGVGYLDQILTGLGCEVRTINNYRDPLFGGAIPEPTEALLSDMKRTVLSYEADLGLALDGDADRFGIIDGDGEFIAPNQFAIILFDYLLSTRTFRGPVCRSLTTTHNLDRIAKQNGLGIIETSVGFKYISESLREKGCILGVEESGGLSIFGHVPEKDGILACVLAAEILACTGKRFKELNREIVAKYGLMHGERLDIKVNCREKERILADLRAYEPKMLAGIKADRYNENNGKQIIMEDGSWLLVRPSGTESLVRVYVEAESEKQQKDMLSEVIIALDLQSE
ncbi:MAG: phosphoglucomutase/phosphomannomutase family protein [Syntrophomonas sp.]|nr:phosphoglucomutase/phosphomannomutase family protein [Syntrophomonas sp.]